MLAPCCTDRGVGRSCGRSSADCRTIHPGTASSPRVPRGRWVSWPDNPGRRACRSFCAITGQHRLAQRTDVPSGGHVLVGERVVSEESDVSGVTSNRTSFGPEVAAVLRFYSHPPSQIARRIPQRSESRCTGFAAGDCRRCLHYCLTCAGVCRGRDVHLRRAPGASKFKLIPEAWTTRSSPQECSRARTIPAPTACDN